MGSTLDEPSLRERCARLAAEIPDQPALRRILFVGALQCEIGAHDMDSLRMTHGLDYLLRSDVVIDPQFEIDIVNLFHGRDFLAESAAADLVFVSFVPNVDHRLFTRLEPTLLEEQRSALESGHGEARAESFFWHARSALHGAEAWRERVASTGASLVLTVGGRKEIGTRVLEGGPYEAIIPTPPYECQPPFRAWPKAQLYEGVAWDVPYKWLGVLAHAGYSRHRPDPCRRPPRTMLATEMARLAANHDGTSP